MFYSAGTLLKKKRKTYNRSFQFIVFAKSIIGKIGATMENMLYFSVYASSKVFQVSCHHLVQNIDQTLVRVDMAILFPDVITSYLQKLLKRNIRISFLDTIKRQKRPYGLHVQLYIEKGFTWAYMRHTMTYNEITCLL